MECVGSGFSFFYDALGVETTICNDTRNDDDRIVKTHKLFRSAEFRQLSSVQQAFIQAMEELQYKFVAVFSSARGVSFASHIIDDGKLAVTPSSIAFATDWKVKNLFSSLGDRMVAFGGSGESVFADMSRPVSTAQSGLSDLRDSVVEHSAEQSTGWRVEREALGAIHEIASMTCYADLKQELHGIKRALTVRGCDVLETADTKRVRPTDQLVEDRVDESDVSSLPLLSTLDMNPHPIRSVHKLWTCGSELGGRPLRDVSGAPNSKKRYGDRATVEGCKKIRYIAVVLELMVLDGMSESDAIEKLERERAGQALDNLAKRILAELIEKGLTCPRKKITSQDVYNNENYRQAPVFWKGL